MSDAPSIPEIASPEADRAAHREAALRRQAERLEQLSEAGLRLALTIEGEAAEARAAGQPVRDDVAMAFARVSRAVRLSVLLHAKVLADMDDAARRDSHVSPDEREAEARRLAEAQRRLDPAYDHKARVEAIVGRVAREAAEDDEHLERLVAEAGERLDDEDIYGQVLGRPVGELVALVCRDLGLDPDWKRLSREAWAQAEIAEGPDGSPFVLREASAKKNSPQRHQGHQGYEDDAEREEQLVSFHVRQ